MWTARVTELANTFSTGQAHVMHIIEPSFHLNLINEWLPPPAPGVVWVWGAQINRWKKLKACDQHKWVGLNFNYF